MAMPYSSQAALMSSSRTAPPGWQMNLTPWRWAWSMLSRKGMKASDAVELGDPVGLLLQGELRDGLLEEVVEDPALGGGELALDVADPPVDAVLALDALLEAQVHDLGVPAQVPDVGL